MDTADRLLTVEELANYLDVPIATIYAWRHRRQGPPGFRVGKHLRFRWTDVERWIEGRLAVEPVAAADRGVVELLAITRPPEDARQGVAAARVRVSGTGTRISTPALALSRRVRFERQSEEVH